MSELPAVPEFIAKMWAYGFVFGLGWFLIWGSVLGLLKWFEEV